MFDPLPKGSASGAPVQLVSEWKCFGRCRRTRRRRRRSTLSSGRRPGDGNIAMPPGALLGIVCRFDTADGKEIRARVCRTRKFGRQWRWLGLPKPRPLYGLDRLAARPAAPVIICEGEKAADAAGALLPDHVAMTSPGGSKAAAASDWSPLAGRKVTIWPDADEAGQGYARDVTGCWRNCRRRRRSRSSRRRQAWPGLGRCRRRRRRLDPGAGAGLDCQRGGPGAPAAEASVPRRRKPQREGLIALFDEAELWHDPEGVAYATVPVAGHRENHEIAGESFRTGSPGGLLRRAAWRRRPGDRRGTTRRQGDRDQPRPVISDVAPGRRISGSLLSRPRLRPLARG